MSSRRSTAEEDHGDTFMNGDDEGDRDNGSRREIRHKYRELMQNMHQNREDMLSSRSNKLTETLEQANKLFEGVSKAREAALDAQLLVLASNLGKEKASQLRADLTVFDPTSFAEDLLTFMGINRLENPDSDSEEEGIAKGYLPPDAWHKLGSEAAKHFRRTPTFHFMLGSFKTDPPVVRQRIDRQKRTSKVEEKRVMPAQLKQMEESHQEATEKEVERILSYLQSYFKDDPETPISFFDFVIDPDSFARTVENIFHASFIIRDGFARIKLDDDKLPVIEPVTDKDQLSQVDKDNQPRYQGVISLSHQDWKEIIETFEITEPMIPPSTNAT
ncbi:PREDICTED: non-structural maintenance of chromosomes element 4 homolog A [Nanorana parkeri]|uniref:non-structural maintenance of chromosomes element 4 homolog A n=1 Tax=Nanorana parkeri TaxID=125878 RepID=UPI000854D9A9|nr:PREDICTED: non-structural maintenance of chromosomes element 4 homolog A [Nanorana parkeri]